MEKEGYEKTIIRRTIINKKYSEMKRNTILLLLLFIVLMAVAYMLLTDPDEQTKSTKEKELLIKIDSSAVDKFIIKNQFGEFTIVKKDGKWQITSPIEYKADDERFNAAVSLLTRINIITMVSDNPGSRDIYEVDTNSRHVRIFENGAQKFDLHFGKAGGKPIETYVRKEGSNEVYLVEGAFSFMFNNPLKDLRDKKIFDVPGNFKEITFQNSKDRFSLTYADSLWLIDGKQADQLSAQKLLTEMKNFTTDFFLDELPDDKVLSASTITIDDVQITFNEIDEERYFVHTNKSPQWFTVLKWKAGKILKTRDDLIPIGE